MSSANFIVKMGDSLMVEQKENKENSIPEPPKFNLKDLPEPPKFSTSVPPSKQNSNVPDIPMPSGFDNLTKAKPELISNIPKIEEPKVILQEQDLLKNALKPAIETPKKKGFLANLFKKKEKNDTHTLSLPPTDKKGDQLSLSSGAADTPYMPPPPKFEDMDPISPEFTQDIQEPKSILDLRESTTTALKINPDKEQGMLQEAENFREEEMLEEGKKYLESPIPIGNVKGIGPAREKKLKRLGIKTAEHLAGHDYKSLSKRTNIPEAHARDIIKNAKKLAKAARIKQDFDNTKVKEEKGISEVVKELEQERREIEHLEKKGDVTEEKIVEIEGHNDLIKVLEALEKKRKQLLSMEEKLTQKEMALGQHDENYKKDIEQIENLRKRLDADVKERTQYLINMEKEYFQKAQTLAKKQIDVEVKEKELSQREKLLKEKESQVKPKASELQDRMATLTAKEKKYEKMMQGFEKQDLLLKDREEDLLKRESEYMQKLDILETHEKNILKQLETKRKGLEAKEKDVNLKESRLHTKERTVDKKGVAVEYAQNILEEQKGKLVDDEFEQYLHEQLGLLRNNGINIDDMNMTKNISVANLDKTKNIYQLVDTCRDLLKTSRVAEAKVFYNQVRDKYYGATFGNQKEKEAVHNLVRSLYDEINLADIGSNR